MSMLFNGQNTNEFEDDILRNFVSFNTSEDGQLAKYKYLVKTL